MDVGIEGVQLVIDREAVLLSSVAPLTVCSSALVGGGIVSCRYIINVHVPKGYAGHDPASDLVAFARARGIIEPFVGLLTAAWTQEAKVNLERADGISVAVVVTVGLSNTIAAGVSPAAACVPSTINTIVLVDGHPEPSALVNAIITATEAKSLALAEAEIKTAGGWRASGTSTDAVVIAATGRGRPLNFAGPVADGGWLIARAVRLAIEAGIMGQKVGS
ncbi:MAG TPA: adenosylcobinamide amidohydrolase [Methylomirabilota bacterium]|nr:adenosylcobinamide amidohydrolase [Methylomirabilota bacterium]